jgi:hypothetical protein
LASARVAGGTRKVEGSVQEGRKGEAEGEMMERIRGVRRERGEGEAKSRKGRRKGARVVEGDVVVAVRTSGWRESA